MSEKTTKPEEQAAPEANEETPAEETQPEETAEETVARLQEELKQRDEQIGKAEYVIEKLKKTTPAQVKTEEGSGASVPSKEELKAEIMAELKSERAVESEAELLANVSDPIEREAIRLELQSGIVRTGDVKADFAKAQTLARAPHLQRVAQEAVKTAQSKNAITNTGGGNNQEKPTSGNDHWKTVFNKSDLEYMEKRGFSEEKMKEAAEKILQNR